MKTKLKGLVLDDLIKSLRELIKENSELSLSNLVLSKLDYNFKNLKQGNHLLINTLPKSGTGYLIEIMYKLTGFKKIFPNNEAFPFIQTRDIYLPKLVDLFKEDLIIHGWHFEATHYNLEIIKKFNLKTVFLYRNIFDILPSIRDHVLKTLDKPQNVLLKDMNFDKMDESEQFDFLIEDRIHKNIKLFVWWYKAKYKQNTDIMFVNYNDLVDSTAETIKNICIFYGLNISDNDINQAIQNINSVKQSEQKIHFNKGVKGRGEFLLTGGQKQRIIQIAKRYTSIDFSMIGIS